MEQQNVLGRTIIARRYEPDNFRCYAVLEHREDPYLAEIGMVYQILEGRQGDSCYGVVESAHQTSDRELLDEILSGKPKIQPITYPILKLLTVRKSGVAAPVGRHDIIQADQVGIRLAYGLPDTGIPIGIFTLVSRIPPSTTVVNLSKEYVIGPESAHINIGGQTGYAKTAFALLICKSLLEFVEDLCVVAFNVKAWDLLWVDKPNVELDSQDKELYSMLGIDPEPFKDVCIYAPAEVKKDSLEDLEFAEFNRALSMRKDGVKVFCWNWKQIKSQVHLGISPEDWDERLEALLGDLIRDENINTFSDAVKKLEDMIPEEQRGWIQYPGGGQHHGATVRKCLRILRDMIFKYAGVIHPGLDSNPIDPAEVLIPGRFTTIDIQMLESGAQRLVVSKVYHDIISKLLRGESKAKHVVFLMDELSKFAPKTAKGPIAEIKRLIEDIAARGRSQGICLLGIEQYPSTVSDEVLGNCATMIWCRMKPMELDAAIYRGLSPEFKQLITRLHKGVALIVHDTHSLPILVRFPRPPCSQNPI